MEHVTDHEVLRLRLLAAFAESDLTHAALAELVVARLGDGSQPSASTMHRLLNGKGASRSATVMAVAGVLGVSLEPAEGDAVCEAIRAYGKGAVGRLLDAAVRMGDAALAATLIERLAEMPPAGRAALLKLMGVDAVDGGGGEAQPREE